MITCKDNAILGKRKFTNWLKVLSSFCLISKIPHIEICFALRASHDLFILKDEFIYSSICHSEKNVSHLYFHKEIPHDHHPDQQRALPAYQKLLATFPH